MNRYFINVESCDIAIFCRKTCYYLGKIIKGSMEEQY